jgi:heme oxygenase (biliverdin-IX-beta and delta-forming)
MIHPFLKLATAAAHANLERALATRGYFDSREGYIDYLRRFHAFHDEAERWLQTGLAGQVIPDWSERRRADLARLDLVSLGVSPSETDFAPVASSNLLPRVSGPEQVLGVAYVLEGSTLGGAFLLKQLAPLGITASRGGSYLASYGSERGRMWQRFLAMLEGMQGQLHAESVAAAAIAAFSAARHYLTLQGPTEATLIERAPMSEDQRTRAARACSRVACTA